MGTSVLPSIVPSRDGSSDTLVFAMWVEQMENQQSFVHRRTQMRKNLGLRRLAGVTLREVSNLSCRLPAGTDLLCEYWKRILRQL